MEQLKRLTETALLLTSDLKNYTEEDIGYGIHKLTRVLEEMRDALGRESPGIQ
jgi:hypothetical protein